MNNLFYLVLAYTFIWTALFVFLLSITARLTRMQREVRQLQEMKKSM
jgi:CcmD family protein